MDFDDDNYTVVLDTLKSPSNKRDPRTLRLAAVAAAMSEVVGNSKDVSAAKVYAATISALEGTLKSEAQSQNMLDSLSTQVALLELLRQTVPHVTNPLILDASLPLSSRVLRGIVSSSLGMDGDEIIQQQADTKDELGGINAVLRAVCRASTELIKCLTPKCDAKLIKQFYFGTIMGLFEDHRPKVRKASQNGIIEILFAIETSPCHPAILKATNLYSHNKLRTIMKGVKKDEEPQPELLHLLAFLQRTISQLDIPTLGADIMELLVALLQQKTSDAQSDYVAMSKKDSASKILAINALLSTVKELMECSSERQEKVIDAFCPRALATLLQNKPALVFLDGAADLDILHRGRTLYGNVVVAACQRVMTADPDLACKLLPVSIQVILQLGRSGDDIDEDVAEPLLTELSALLRTNFRRLLNSASCTKSSLDTCTTNSLKALEQVMHLAFQPIWSVSLKALVIMVQMVDTHEMVPDIVDSLLFLRNESSGDINAQRAVETAVASLIEGVGIEEFWKWVDWTFDDSSKKKSSNQGMFDGWMWSWIL